MTSVSICPTGIVIHFAVLQNHARAISPELPPFTRALLSPKQAHNMLCVMVTGSVAPLPSGKHVGRQMGVKLLTFTKYMTFGKVT